MDLLLKALFDTTITNWELIALLCLPGIISGVRRGWQEEGFTAIGLGIAVSGLGQRFADFLILLANRLVGVFPLGVAIIMGKPPSEWPSPGDDVINPEGHWAQLVAFVLIVLVSYRAGTILGRRRGISVLGRLAGALFGIINVILILARVFVLFNPLEKEYTIDITVNEMRADLLSGLIYGLIGLVIALFLFMAWFNRRRAQE